MQFNSIQDVLYMAGHGQYVWLAYGITMSLVLALIALPIIKKRKLSKIIQHIAQLDAE